MNSAFRGGDNNIQTLNCNTVGEFGCVNVASGNDNTQVMNCNTVRNEGCRNSMDVNQTSNRNTQNVRCLFVSTGCVNNVLGDGNTQNLLCVKSSQCTNEINFLLLAIHRSQFV